MRRTDGGYVGLISLLVVCALVAAFYFMRPGTLSGTATSTSSKVGQSSMEQDLGALQSAKALQDVSAKHAADVNAQMQ